MPILDLDEVGVKKKNVLHDDILMGGSHTSFKFDFSSPSKLSSTKSNVTPKPQKIAKFQ